MYSFDCKAEGAAFSCAIMIKIIGDHNFGKNDRKNYADRQGEKQYFSFGTQFHTIIIPGFRFSGKRRLRFIVVFCEKDRNIILDFFYQI
jgi:hypothetical protein